MHLRVTLRDIAHACGVGKSTVARVLSGSPQVSDEVRAQVLRMAGELGYRPDPSLRVLAQHRWKRGTPAASTLAVIDLKSKHSNALAIYRPGLAQAAERAGYRLEEYRLSHYGSLKRIGEVIHHRGIRGLIVPPVTDALEWSIDWSPFCTVGCGVGEYRLPVHSVDISYFSATRLCWRECRARGYRRIGALLFRQPGPDTNDSLRHAAVFYEQSLLSAGEVTIPPFSGTMQDNEGIARWFRHHRPDAVISLNEGALWVLRDLGEKIPETVGYCILSHPGKSQFDASGAATHRSHIAESAVNWLDQLLRSNQFGLPSVPDVLLVEPHWIEGRTLRPR